MKVLGEPWKLFLSLFQGRFLTVKVDNVEGTILNWLQNKVKLSNDLKQHAG